MSIQSQKATNSYVAITGSAFEHVKMEDGSDYQFGPNWSVKGFSNANNPRIPKRDPNYVFSLPLLMDILFFLQNPQGSGLWVSGPTGCGKTSAIMQIAARLNWPVVDLTLNDRFEFSDLRGQWGLIQKDANVSPSMKYILNALPMAMKYGYILVLNEADLAYSGQLAGLNDVIEGRNLLIPEHHAEVIKPHPMFRLIVTANSNGSGDTTGLYQGVQQQNVAAMDRYRMLKVSYPTTEVEEGILKNVTPEINENTRQLMCRFASEMRFAFMGTTSAPASISIPFSTRTLVNWAQALRMYKGQRLIKYPIKKTLELFFLNKLSEEEAEAANSAGLAIFGEEAWDRN